MNDKKTRSAIRRALRKPTILTGFEVEARSDRLRTRIPLSMERRALTVLLFVYVCTAALVLVAARGVDIGTDTSSYALFYRSLDYGGLNLGFEPGFVYFSKLVHALQFGITGYQAGLFVLLLSTVLLATWKFSQYLGGTQPYAKLLIASFMLLLMSPFFVAASINIIRQGLASLIVFSALLAFQQRQWGQFVVLIAVATSLHYSSILFLPFAPLLLFDRRVACAVSVIAFVLYCSGVTLLLVRLVAPPVYAFVVKYGASREHASGIRLDFAVFSMFWYWLPYAGSRFVHSTYRARIKDSSSVYLVLLLPFFSVGWGDFSYRYLVAAWLAASLIVAAMICHSRIFVLRTRLFLELGLVFATIVFFFQIAVGIG